MNCCRTNTKLLAHKLIDEESLLTAELLPQVEEVLDKLKKKLLEPIKSKFYLYTTLQTHVLPLTNVCFDKLGNRCLTGSYDRTCIVWNVENGKREMILQGHDNVVFSVNYNYPQCNRILTGSFDKSAKIWNAPTGRCMNTFWGHRGEVVSAEFAVNKYENIVTASMDNTARIFHVETGDFWN